MKTTKLISTVIVAILLTVGLNLNASTPPAPSAESKADFNKTLDKIMQYPGDTEGEKGETMVWVNFQVDDSGMLKVKETVGKMNYADYVKNELNGFQVNNPDMFDREYLLKIRFELQ